VRDPFAVSFTCERENAQAACLPLRPMELRFNAPVTRKLASADPPERWRQDAQAQVQRRGGTRPATTR
jgi:hypothetical protein